MLTRLEAYRYKCFRQMAVDVSAFNVVAGPNGSGKTTLLDIPGLIGEMIGSRRISDSFLQPLDGAAPRAERLGGLIHRGRGDEFMLALEAEVPDAVKRVSDPEGRLSHLRYEVRLQVLNDTELVVLNEYLFAFAAGETAPEKGGGLQGEPVVINKTARPTLRQRDWRPIIHRDSGDPVVLYEETKARHSNLQYRLSPSQLGLSIVPTDHTLFPAAVWFSELLSQGTTFFQPETRVLRKAAPPGRADRVEPAGGNIARLAFDLQRSRPERFGAWVEHVKTALTRVSDISVQEREDDRYVYLQVRYGDEYDVPAAGLSEGTLRVLALTLLPYLEVPPSVLVTEEPENGVHPTAIESVLLSLQSVYGGQVWVSTHSPIVLAGTRTEDVLLSVLNEAGEATMIAGAEHERLAVWKGAVDLGSLFAAGVLS